MEKNAVVWQSRTLTPIRSLRRHMSTLNLLSILLTFHCRPSPTRLASSSSARI